MSSNPFRRKPNDGTPSASGRTSLDIQVDQERLQQVAQQAFADADDELEPAGSSGPTSTPDARPNLTISEVATKVPDALPESKDDKDQEETKRPSSEVTGDIGVDTERKLEVVLESPILEPKTNLSSSDITNQVPNKPSNNNPTPPPARPLAPPAPPRPRRSVKRAREEVPEKKPIVEEAPVPEVPVPVAPKDEDPFAEEKLKSTEDKDDSSSIYEIKKEDADIASVQSIESEYEEDSPSEVSEIPTVSATSLSVKTVASEPEYAATTTSPQTQAPNPFRKPTDPESPTLRRESLDEKERNDKFEVLPPSIKFGSHQNSGSQLPKANRQSLDVDAFKRLMLTGQAVPTAEPEQMPETNSSPKPNTLEAAEPTYTPRSSQDTGRSAYDVESEPAVKAVLSTASPPPKAKPPPPKPRGQRISMPPPPRSDPSSLSQKEVIPETIVPRESPATPPKTSKPPAPLSRRISAQITANPEGGYALQSPPPPPPPPSRRTPSSPKGQPPTPPAGLQEPPPQLSLSTSPLQNKKPTPPPARRGSKRMSAPPGRLQAAAAATSSNLSKPASIPAPPPPPIRKKSQLSQSTTEGSGGTGDPVTEPPQPVSRSSFDILDDLTKLQKEVDELMGRV